MQALVGGCDAADANYKIFGRSNARLLLLTSHRKFVFRKRNKMLNLKDITAMTFHLNENNNPEEKKTSLKLEINESFWLGNYDSKSRLLLLCYP